MPEFRSFPPTGSAQWGNSERRGGGGSDSRAGDRGDPCGESQRRGEHLDRQANHFMHLDTDLRTEMNALREDMNRRFEAVDRRFNSMQWLIGLGIAFLTVLMSLYRFFQ